MITLVSFVDFVRFVVYSNVPRSNSTPTEK
jgi:hypothetical protein